ncbi:FCD domain-containing protein (plasmid) [Streptomyces sp. NBC_00841]|uniref:FadR/GntR family transcriptional regulator n=1 Tax=unclassified Streptomyces TaxID=2593676 RepID=UPI00225A395A|nr:MULTISPECIES: FCD domain-containing protein [unclassified Streptomyces]MCX4538826.1 FCD domain-containing protein [Streptomyces sp. NBC_01669]WSA05379.1 FCD domain-containing protein [Streptomyces sp. NBC_00841]
MTIGRTTLSHQVAQAIIEEIAERGLRAGDEIPAEGEMAERYGVNRLVVREAIRTLMARGVLISSQGKRARVATPSPVVLEQILTFRLSQASLDRQDLLETRSMIETELARRAARRVADGLGSVAATQEALAAMRAANGEPEAFITADLSFHQAIADLAGSGLLTFLLTAMHGVLLEERRASYRGRARRGAAQEATVEAHQRILDAIAKGDPGRAAEAMTEHLAETGLDLGL